MSRIAPDAFAKALAAGRNAPCATLKEVS